jgi:catechol 2,3-dioxygenase-like lactoylglutathione lyase family enzyme
VPTVVAFIAYPVSDLVASRRFYDTVLEQSGAAMTDEWIEYALGDTTFVITQADADHPVPVSGALLAFELSNLAEDVARLRDHSVQFRGDIVETAVYRFIVAVDPDGSEFLIHQRKAALDAPQTI